MTTGFEIHPQLRRDSEHLARLPCSELLLHRNAQVPWFILVPRTACGELHELPRDRRIGVMDEADALAGLVLAHFRCRRINRASIGNRVPQLHLHVIGRREDDPCWPDVVWGRLATEPSRDPASVAAIREVVLEHLPGASRAAD